MKNLLLFFAVLLTACSTMNKVPDGTIYYIPDYGIDYWRYYPSYPWYYEPYPYFHYRQYKYRPNPLPSSIHRDTYKGPRKTYTKPKDMNEGVRNKRLPRQK